MSRKKDGSVDFCNLDNVIPLQAFRLKAQARSKEGLYYHVLYVTEQAQSLSLLRSFPYLKVIPVSSRSVLQGRLAAGGLDLGLIEANLTWDDPVNLIREFTSASDAPVLLLGFRNEVKRRRILKPAFAAGLHDVLPTPLRRDELSEALEVLLKLRPHYAVPAE